MTYLCSSVIICDLGVIQSVAVHKRGAENSGWATGKAWEAQLYRHFLLQYSPEFIKEFKFK